MSRLLIIFFFYAHLSPGQLIEKSKSFFEAKNYSEAKPLLSGIRETEQQFAEAQYYLGRIATEEKKYELAVNYFEKSVATNPASAEYHNWLGVLYGVLALDANPIRKAFLAPKIKNEFEKAAAIDPANIPNTMGIDSLLL
ncbi:hypothetical protein WSM22_02430 [Cytophagales bacterium WSM2-2]|nr:hypothetical protein WSM22_02430 [Cytophagales bacterium WSM2-2]